jgi:hypothetical protein
MGAGVVDCVVDVPVPVFMELAAGGEGVKARESDSAGEKLPPRSWADPKRYLRNQHGQFSWV